MHFLIQSKVQLYYLKFKILMLHVASRTFYDEEQDVTLYQLI